jgi:hypothetical protein
LVIRKVENIYGCGPASNFRVDVLLFAVQCFDFLGGFRCRHGETLVLVGLTISIERIVFNYCRKPYQRCDLQAITRRAFPFESSLMYKVIVRKGRREHVAVLCLLYLWG